MSSKAPVRPATKKTGSANSTSGTTASKSPAKPPASPKKAGPANSTTGTAGSKNPAKPAASPKKTSSTTTTKTTTTGPRRSSTASAKSNTSAKTNTSTGSPKADPASPNSGRASRQASEQPDRGGGAAGSPAPAEGSNAEGQPAGSTPQPETAGNSATPQPESGSTAEAEPAREKTEEELEIERLQAERDSKQMELSEIEASIKDANTYMRSINMVEKAHSLDEKSDENLEEIKKMKGEIQVMRNSDRVMVSLKDTRENMTKHVRMRKAHIRQKEATINLIDQRCQEQVEKVHYVLEKMAADSEETSKVTARRKEAEVYTHTIQPLVSAAACLREDAKDEEFIMHCQILCQEMIDDDAAIDRRLHETHENLHVGAHRKAVEKEEEKVMVDHLWTEEKKTLMSRYMQATNLRSENQFHVRRGTNLKSFEVLNLKATTCVAEDLRRLRMIHEETLLGNAVLEKELNQLQARVDRGKQQGTNANKTAGGGGGAMSPRKVDEAALKKLLKQLQTRHENLEKENLKLQQDYNELQEEYASNTMPLLTGGSMAGGASDNGAYTPRRRATTPTWTSPRSEAAKKKPVPKKVFTSDSLARLQQPTKARNSHLDAHEADELRRREIINSVRNNRPSGLTNYM